MKLAWLLVAITLAAQDLPKGTVVEHVACRKNPKQSYALYLPSTYARDRQWPILYCLDPLARGSVPVKIFAKAAERAGVIVVGSNNSRNGDLAIPREAIPALLDDTMERFPIDQKRIYAAGFSGGARVALAWAGNGAIAGVIACGAGFNGDAPLNVPFLLYATAGVDDFNYHELYELSMELAVRSVPHRFVEFAGGHDWLPESLTDEAFAYFAGRVPDKPAAESREEEKLALRVARVYSDLFKAEGERREKLIRRLNQESAKPEDGADRRCARRVLYGTFVHEFEQAQQSLAQKNWRQAESELEFAALLKPDSAGVWFSLATAYAGAGDNRRALDALEKAVANGLHGRARFEQEPLFAPLRSDPRYKALLPPG